MNGQQAVQDQSMTIENSWVMMWIKLRNTKNMRKPCFLRLSNSTVETWRHQK